MKTKLVLNSGSHKFGASMGRLNSIPEQYRGDDANPIKLRMERLQWVDFDYDQYGAYWGHQKGTHIYCAWNDDLGVMVFVRSANRKHAKEYVRTNIPQARFFN